MFIEALLNQALQTNPDYLKLLTPLVGETLLLKITDLGMGLLILPLETRIQLRFHRLSQVSETGQCTLVGTRAQFMKLLKQSKSPAAIQLSGIQVIGSVHVLSQYQTLQDQLNLDLEALLAPYLGDTLAGGLKRLSQAFRSSLKSQCNSTQADLQEYLQEEAKLLAHPAKIEQFYEDLQTFRQELSRTEARIARLEE